MLQPARRQDSPDLVLFETVEVTTDLIASWIKPPFQREVTENAKVLEVAEDIRLSRGVIPGVITIGMFESVPHLVDGQHRLLAWDLSGVRPGYADVLTKYFTSMAAMAREFVILNSSVRKMRPDDIMRALESSTPALQRIHRDCTFIGYDMIRYHDNSPVVSMSVFVRNWMGTRADVPTITHGAVTAVELLDDQETDLAINFARLCYAAWGRDREYARLWGSLNLMVCAWLYRRLVGKGNNVGMRRSTVYSPDEFLAGLMALSADREYVAWLVGRNVGERDRSPAYGRIKSVFQRRYLGDTGKKAMLPTPSWVRKT